MSDAELLARWHRDEAARFQGWDFSYIADRFVEASPPWDYPALARQLIAGSSAVLDMETGGGEMFAGLAPFRGRTVAIEAYSPNVAIAKRRLEPLGVEVLEAHATGPLPFSDSTFDLALNRHGAFNAKELARVLRSGGTFLTQQVAGDDLVDLMARFGAEHQWPDHTLANVARDVAAAGFAILRAEEWRGVTCFDDVGALIYFLKASPFVVPNFSIDRHLEVLKTLHAERESKASLEFISSRFLIHAQR